MYVHYHPCTHVSIYLYSYMCIYEHKNENEEDRQRSKPKGEEDVESIIGKVRHSNPGS